MAARATATRIATAAAILERTDRPSGPGASVIVPVVGASSSSPSPSSSTSSGHGRTVVSSSSQSSSDAGGRGVPFGVGSFFPPCGLPGRSGLPVRGVASGEDVCSPSAGRITAGRGGRGSSWLVRSPTTYAPAGSSTSAATRILQSMEEIVLGLLTVPHESSMRVLSSSVYALAHAAGRCRRAPRLLVRPALGRALGQGGAGVRRPRAGGPADPASRSTPLRPSSTRRWRTTPTCSSCTTRCCLPR